MQYKAEFHLYGKRASVCYVERRERLLLALQGSIGAIETYTQGYWIITDDAKTIVAVARYIIVGKSVTLRISGDSAGFPSVDLSIN